MIQVIICYHRLHQPSWNDSGSVIRFHKKKLIWMIVSVSLCITWRCKDFENYWESSNSTRKIVIYGPLHAHIFSPCLLDPLKPKWLLIDFRTKLWYHSSTIPLLDPAHNGHHSWIQWLDSAVVWYHCSTITGLLILWLLGNCNSKILIFEIFIQYTKFKLGGGPIMLSHGVMGTGT